MDMLRPILVTSQSLLIFKFFSLRHKSSTPYALRFKSDRQIKIYDTDNPISISADAALYTAQQHYFEMVKHGF